MEWRRFVTYLWNDPRTLTINTIRTVIKHLQHRQASLSRRSKRSAALWQSWWETAGERPAWQAQCAQSGRGNPTYCQHMSDSETADLSLPGADPL